MTNGLFDPTIHSVLSRSGYDKTFDSLKNLKNDKKVSEKIDEKKSSFEEFSINEKDKTISSPPGLKIDLGGIAKGFWVDKMKDLLDKQCNDYWISAGGDIFIKGKDEKDECWQVAVQNPLKLDEDLLYLNIPDGGFGIATSGVTKRQWIKNGKKRNHLIDIRTNTQVKNSILSVTVIAKTTTDADVMAKTVLILGIKKGLALVHSIQDYECVIIDKNLKMFISNGLKKFL
jgi:thiamine biosynthesis lipoprotein